MNTLYTKAREAFVAGDIVWEEGGSVIKAALVRGYTFSSSHQFLSDVTGNGGTIVATETLQSLTNVDGVLDAADAVWEAVPEGAPIPYCIIYQASAVTGGADVAATAQRLIVFIDRGPGITGNTLIPNGQNITSAWSPGADRIARI
jgi:hypothetical protein